MHPACTRSRRMRPRVPHPAVDSFCRPGARDATLARMTTRGRRWLVRFADDRGDVPGWVLITLMTAALVILIWALAGPALSDIFQNAIDKVAGI